MKSHFIYIFLSILLCICNVHNARLHLTPPFLHGFPDGTEDWKLSGTASMLESYVQLTASEKGKFGSIYTTSQWKSKDWEAEFIVGVCI